MQTNDTGTANMTDVAKTVIVAASRAAEVFAQRALHPADVRSRLLEQIVTRLEADAEAIIAAADAETSLGLTRLNGEMGRTAGQLRLFADVVREGSWVDARIDTGTPDLRRMLRPLGPVAVFGASNFPLAFSVPGGDTASALAAGCPVVVKAHPAHPETSRLCAAAIAAAAADLDLPAGVFALVEGGQEAGEALVDHPAITAVGFTGSLRAGRALFDRAAARPTPIPVYAELGSINPVFVLPAARSSRAEQITEMLSQSVTLGVGQFCTNPGVVVGLDSDPAADLAEQIAAQPASTMLTDGIGQAFAAGLDQRAGIDGVSVTTTERAAGTPAALRTTIGTALANPLLTEELFGPATVIVEATEPEQILHFARQLEGQLTASIFADAADAELVDALVDILSDKVGRIVFDGVPTGVAVSHAMHHGGPYPASTSVRDTSVGSAAIVRFAKPVSYQDVPSQHLPPELQDDNPRRITRMIDGIITVA